MTGFASQGKTQADNVVDLRFMRTHQGYYIALSCSTTATGTLILGGFHLSKVMGGASGALCQEFHELELLDEITTLHYEDKLPRRIAMSNHRNTMIALFREKRGLQYMLSNMHRAIRWNKCDPYLESKIARDQEVTWRFVVSGPTDNLQHASENPQNNKIIQHWSEESSPDHKEKRLRGTKRKGPDDANPLKACSKRLKISQSVVSGVNNHLPPGC